jgi:hypothetical protein
MDLPCNCSHCQVLHSGSCCISLCTNRRRQGDHPIREQQLQATPNSELVVLHKVPTCPRMATNFLNSLTHSHTCTLSHSLSLTHDAAMFQVQNHTQCLLFNCHHMYTHCCQLYQTNSLLLHGFAFFQTLSPLWFVQNKFFFMDKKLWDTPCMLRNE